MSILYTPTATVSVSTSHSRTLAAADLPQNGEVQINPCSDLQHSHTYTLLPYFEGETKDAGQPILL